MYRQIRKIMLWLLIAALPVQGFAATGGMPCTMSHHILNKGVHNVCDESLAANSEMLHDSGVFIGTGRFEHRAPAHPGTRQHSCQVCPSCHLFASAPPPYAEPAPRVADVAYDGRFPTSPIKGWISSRLERPPRA